MNGDGPDQRISGWRRHPVILGLASVAVVLALAAVAAGPIMSRVEQPHYTASARAGAIELRDYAPMIVAETEVSGERTPAIQDGFRRIAAYIFGANRSSAKIAMTAPVQQQAGKTIAMTAPVTQQQAGDQGRWTVSFVMPAAWTLETLPAPKDDRVRLRPIPAQRKLAIRFSGIATDSVIEAKAAELRSYARQHDLKLTGDPLLAFYNPPWTLPFLRRNEVILDVRPIE